MTPLEAAKELQAADPFVMNERAGTAFCFACGSYDGHAPGCAWLAMPQIVAALEAAAPLLDSLEPYSVPMRSVSPQGVYWFCKGVGAPMASAHAPDCQWLAAQAAIKAWES